MPLGPAETERYARHIVLKGLGGQGQQKLKSASIVILGAGALGSAALAYLAAAGIGRITLVDHDRVALSNLQRQIIHRSDQIGRPKAETGSAFANALNPGVAVTPVVERLTGSNARTLIAGHDVVLDASDNFATRLAVSDAAFHEELPLVTGAIMLFDGTLTTILAYRRDSAGNFLPSFRCLYPEPPESLPACAELGVLGPVAGVIGSLMAVEAIKLIAGIGEPLMGRLLVYDGRDARFSEIAYRWRASNPLTGSPTEPVR
jgi:adenylyltransferase/sulfurtransferase